MKKSLLIIITYILIVSGCDLTSLNKNEKAPINVDGMTLFSNAQASLGRFLEDGPNYMPQYWTNTTYATASQYEIYNSNLPGNEWQTIYHDVLSNLKNAKKIIENDDALSAKNKQNKLASIEVLKALAYSILVNNYGDIPYSNALDPENSQPAYDDANTIYNDLISRLSKAISNFDVSSDGFGLADIYYNGDIGKWLKFANALKMRLAITIADVNSSMAQSAIEEASPNAFASNADNALIPFQSTTPNTNPIWENLVQSGRHDIVPAQPLVSRMNDLNDPRRSIFFTELDGKYVGGIYGVVNNYDDYSHVSALIKKKDRPGMILGYDEVEFIRAEASARGYNISGNASVHYENAIRADMNYWGVSNSKIDSYLAQSGVAYNSASGSFRKKIGLQKWFALFLQPLQAWTEVRRLDTPDLKAPEGAAVDSYPTRFTYPLSERSLNKVNYQMGSSAIGGDELTTKLFWDVN